MAVTFWVFWSVPSATVESDDDDILDLILALLIPLIIQWCTKFENSNVINDDIITTQPNKCVDNPNQKVTVIVYI